MFDLGIESVKRFNECAHYDLRFRQIWLVEFRDYTSVVILENWDRELFDTAEHSIEGNFVMEEEALNA